MADIKIENAETQFTPVETEKEDPDDMNFGNTMVNQMKEASLGSPLMRQKKAEIMTINRTVYDEEKDPLFFVYLNRLAKAAYFKENDRMDGRKALDQFILEETSLMYAKGMSTANDLRGKMIKELGITEDDLPKDQKGEDAVDMLHRGIEELLAIKQTLKPIKTKELHLDLINNFIQQSNLKETCDPSKMPAVREKNLIQKRTNTNRSPVNMEQRDVKLVVSDTHTQDTHRSMNVASPSFQALQKSVNNNVKQQPENQITLPNRVSSLMKNSTVGRCTGPHEFSQGEISPSAPRFVQPEDPIKFSSSMIKLSTKPELKLSKLVSMDKKRMGESDRFKFTLGKTHNLDNRSPLCEPDKPNIYARIPVQFGVKSDSESHKANVDQEETPIGAATQQHFSFNQLETTKNLIKQGGSSAYLMLKYNIENMQRTELGNFNNTIVKHNNEELTGAQSTIQRQILHKMKSFVHKGSMRPSETPLATKGGQLSQNDMDMRLNHTIGVATCSGDLYSHPGQNISYIPGEKKPINRFKYVIKHDAERRLTNEKQGPIMNQIGSIIERKSTLASLKEATLNSFGLKKERDVKDKYVLPPEASVVVFVEDGDDIENCKCFRYNLAEMMDKYRTTNPNTGAIPLSKYNEQNTRFLKQSFKELIEQCSEILGKPYTHMYSLEGYKLETMETLNTYLKDKFLRELMDGSDSPSARRNTLQKIQDDANLPRKLSKQPTDLQLNKQGTRMTSLTNPASGQNTKRMLNERSGSVLSHLTIGGRTVLPQILLLSRSDYFVGLQDGREQKTGRELRVANAVGVRKWMQELSTKLQNKLYLEWVERVSGVIDHENVNGSLKDFAANNFRYGNTNYWDRIKEKVQNSPYNKIDKKVMKQNKFGNATFKVEDLKAMNNQVKRAGSTIISPPFQGGGLYEANDFMLPQIKNLNMTMKFQQDRLSEQPHIQLRVDNRDTNMQLDVSSNKSLVLKRGSIEPSGYQSPIFYGSLSRNWNPNTYKTLDVIIEDTKKDYKQRERELAHVKLSLPPTTRKMIPFNQRVEINQTKPQSKPNSVAVAKAYANSLEPRQKKLIAETIDHRGFKDRKQEQLRETASMASLRQDHIHTLSPKDKTEAKFNSKMKIDFELVRMLSKQYNMTGKEIYDLYTKFNCMHEIVKAQKYGIAKAEGDFINHSQGSDDEEVIKKNPANKISGGVQEYDYQAGLPLEIFLSNCNVFKGKHEEVTKAILKALNIQYTLKNCKVTLHEFLNMSAIMTHFTAAVDESLDFWMRIINPASLAEISKQQFQKILEYFVIGSYSEAKGNLVSELFCKGFYEMLWDKGLVEKESQMIRMEELRKSFLDGRNNLEYFHQLLKPNCDYVLEGNYGKY